MAVAATSHGGSGSAPRAALVIAGLLFVGTGAWFASSWIDTGSDSTCGAVIHPDIWLDDSAPSSCRALMAIRAAISAATVVVAGALFYLAARGRPTTPARAATILTLVAAAYAGLVLINERVRSGGAL